MDCSGCSKPVTETQLFVTCATCEAVSHWGCDSHCVCDGIAPNRVGEGSPSAAMLKEAAERKGMNCEDLARLMLLLQPTNEVRVTL
jgi:hypothetical protein